MQGAQILKTRVTHNAIVSSSVIHWKGTYIKGIQREQSCGHNKCYNYRYPFHTFPPSCLVMSDHFSFRSLIRLINRNKIILNAGRITSFDLFYVNSPANDKGRA